MILTSQLGRMRLTSLSFAHLLVSFDGVDADERHERAGALLGGR